MKQLILCLALAVGALPACAAQPAPSDAAAPSFQPAQLRNFTRSQLAIERRGGRDTLQIWLAQTSEEQQQGLMFIQQLPNDHGMLFVLGTPRPMSMWMKNTYVSLDMLFVDARGRVTHIVERAKPLSEDIISSGGAVAGVLEMAGGEVQRRRIAVGDRLRHPVFVGDN
ncbi:MAG: DUF192 domain-containing protein [Steroidobacteraceae bacterium]